MHECKDIAGCQQPLRCANLARCPLAASGGIIIDKGKAPLVGTGSWLGALNPRQPVLALWLDEHGNIAARDRTELWRALVWWPLLKIFCWRGSIRIMKAPNNGDVPR